MQRQMMVKELKERVARGRYAVDCDAVATAFLARQTRCSNPLTAASPDELDHLIPAGPRITRPTGSSRGCDGTDGTEHKSS